MAAPDDKSQETLLALIAQASDDATLTAVGGHVYFVAPIDSAELHEKVLPRRLVDGVASRLADGHFGGLMRAMAADGHRKEFRA